MLFLASTAGCFGQLTLSEANIHATCTTSAECGFGQICNTTDGRCMDSPGACSATVTNGDCARGQICDGGICICVNSALCNCDGGVCLASWCDCSPGQGCDDGACVTIVGSGPTANNCAPERPNGLCADGVTCCGGTCCGAATDVCVGNFCVPNERPCSASEPFGWCGQGLGCNSGRCEPLEQCACSASRTTGCCADGFACDGGTCAARACTSTTPGACSAGQVCETTGCQTIECSPGHTTGSCSSGYCGACGSCIPNGTCCARADCSNTQFCDSSSHCRTLDTCADDIDCTLQLGQGYTCSGGACVERTSCTATADCTVGKFCSAQNHCLAAPACDVAADCNNSNQFCSANHTCQQIGCCAVDVDCGWPGQQKICVERGSCDTCVDYLTCDAAHTGDCPPGYSCNTVNNTCDVITGPGTTCDTNDFTTTCNPGELNCCAVAGANHCCAAGQHCSLGIGKCIPMGQCLTNSDCDNLLGATGFVCSDFACVPAPADACPCAAGQHCASVRDAFGNSVSGCVEDTGCGGIGDCPGGYRCNAEYQCELDPQCGAQELAVNGIVPPNVLIVFDRSRSMQLCGPGDSTFGDCGFNYSGNACNDANPATACTPQCTNGVSTSCDTLSPLASGQMECTAAFIDADTGSLTTANVCNDQQCTAGCNPTGPFNGDHSCANPYTIPRWTEALAAIKGDNGTGGVLGLIDTYLGEVAFGLSIFPHPPGTEACTQACRYTSCTDVASAAGSLDVPIGFGLPTHNNIEAALNATVPGGGTPTAKTLRNILALADHGGLDDVDRANAILLVTDGAATGDNDSIATCEPPCSNAIKDGGETGVDCGGLCGPCLQVGGESCAGNANCDSRNCVAGFGCEAPSCISDDDCFSHLCRDGECRQNTCANATKDSNETDIDCGGECQPCGESAACIIDRDCGSSVCNVGVCAPASCSDALKNGSETGVDCGGACTATCADNTGCVDNTDCTSGFCDTLTDLCRPAHCNNGSTDGGETGLNCGGGGCVACVTGCTNGVKDGSETDIDCGGSCPDCFGARTCSVAGDCVSNTCTVCAADASGISTGPQSCRVLAAIDRLYASTPRIKTFVVGFQISGNASLNCDAVYGKTARRDVVGCDALTRATCGNNGAPTCYYDASNPAALQLAFDNVIKQVSSCRFTLSSVPPDPFGIFVYLQDPGDPNIRVPVVGGSNWHYDFSTNQVEFFGNVCDQVKGGAQIPIVVYGCAVTGG